MQYITWQLESQIGFITLNRPDKKNALNRDFVSELEQAFSGAKTNPACRVVILQSSGDVFCAGADLGYLKQLQSNTHKENIEDSVHLMELFKLIYTFPKVVISMVTGPAIAGGCGLATVTDYCFATPESKFGYSEVKIGFVPAIVMVFLLRKIGEGKAKEILLSGEIFKAARAKDIGLINTVVKPEEIKNFTIDFANSLIKKTSGQSVAIIKQMIGDIPELSLNDALQYAAEMNATMRQKDDCKKGISAFLNKESISWE
ncbi:MAG: methylglutaconyl-CoA hydratase [Bacteroidia bacterium]|jgi:methylglutaconyl-CoA hydratase